MIHNTRYNLNNPMKVGYNEIESNFNVTEKQYQYCEISRLFYDRIRVKDPLTIYIVAEPIGNKSVYLGENKIPKHNYDFSIEHTPDIRFKDWLPTYLHHLIVDYHNDSIPFNKPDTVDPSIICNILEASGKYDVSDLELFPMYIARKFNGTLLLHERMQYVKGPYDQVLDLFAVYDFFDMVNKTHTEKDADKYDISGLIESIVKLLS